jgi:hypothetical protein
VTERDGRAFRERAQHRADLNVSPFATARRSHVALVELCGNGVVADDAGPFDLLDNRQHTHSSPGHEHQNEAGGGNERTENT